MIKMLNINLITQDGDDWLPKPDIVFELATILFLSFYTKYENTQNDELRELSKLISNFSLISTLHWREKTNVDGLILCQFRYDFKSDPFIWVINGQGTWRASLLCSLISCGSSSNQKAAASAMECS